MAHLSLYLTGLNRPELYRVVFAAGGDARVSVRGKAALETRFTFQWTAAVKALTVFFLRAVSSDTRFLLAGARGSLASSLDFAIGKEPGWMLDTFGIDRRGKSILRRLIRRSNSECKLPGPVTLALNESLLSRDDIAVYAGGELVTDPDILTRAADEIANSLEQNRTAGARPAAPMETERPALSRTVLCEMLVREATEMLWRLDFFGPSRLRNYCAKLARDPSVVRIAGEGALFADKLDLELPTALRVGMGEGVTKLRRSLEEDGPLKVVVPWIMYTPLLLFQYLKYFKDLPLEIDYEWGYAIEVRRALARGEIAPDLCVLAIGPAASLVSQSPRSSYKPLMLLPSISHRIVIPSTGEEKTGSIGEGEYFFLCEEPSSPQFCFEELERRRLVDRRRVSVAHLEPDEAAAVIDSGNPDARLLMFFPHYAVHQRLSGVRTLAPFDGQSQTKESVLFASESLMRNSDRARSVDVALRHAWLELREHPIRLRELVQLLLADKRLRKFLFHLTGMHHVGRRWNQSTDLMVTEDIFGVDGLD